jgi:hypothetical protein
MPGVTVTYKPPSKWEPDVTEYRPKPFEQPATLPKDSKGQAINEDRRKRKADEAAFREQHGRKMRKKDRKRSG